MSIIQWWVSRFKWEPDNWWWEQINMKEAWGWVGLEDKLPAWTFVIPDKLSHFLTCFLLTWLFFRLGLNRHWAAFLGWFIMMGPWEILLDGCFRHGASWKDMIANTLGTILCWWWLASYGNVGQSQL